MTNELKKCSKKCGFGCTQKAFDRATSEAQALADLLGERWTPRVWENCGWNYEARKGVASVNPRKEGNSIAGDWKVTGYQAWLNLGSSHSAAVQFIERGSTPEEALAVAIQRARALVNRANEELAKLCGDA